MSALRRHPAIRTLASRGPLLQSTTHTLSRQQYLVPAGHSSTVQVGAASETRVRSASLFAALPTSHSCRNMSSVHGATSYVNRLAKAKSPYLLQHANNPVSEATRVGYTSIIGGLGAENRQVDWYEWGPEAFEKAKKDNKPIFLSVSSC